MLAVLDLGFGYKLMALLHILTAVVAFGPLFLYPGLRKAGETATMASLHMKMTFPALVLLWVFGMFLGFLILLYHLQLNLFANINYTFRRGSFKMWPVAIFYLSTTVLFHKLSEKLKNWENS